MRASSGWHGATMRIGLRGDWAFQRAWGDRPNPPVITAAVVKALARPEFLLEMDAIAVVSA